MALMHFFAQLGMMRLGPYLLSMPDDMDDIDQEEFADSFRRFENSPSEFEHMFSGLSDDAAMERIQQMSEAFMDHKYLLPKKQVFTSFHAATFIHKDYYLPALKVFNFKDDEYWSPARTARWKNMELKAEHLEIANIAEYKILKDKSHKVGFQCDCGIYGSVNVEELNLYFHGGAASTMVQLDPHFTAADHKLCIIEPSNGSDVFVARKGWKTTKSFISEVIGETISIPDASELLSMVWQRPIDIRKIYTIKGMFE